MLQFCIFGSLVQSDDLKALINTMRSTVFFAFFFCAVLSANWAQEVEKVGKVTDKSAYLSCTKCKDGNDVFITPSVTFAKMLHYLVVNLSVNVDGLDSQVQQTLKNYFTAIGADCSLCEVGYTVCQPAGIPKYKACTNKTATFSVQEIEGKSNRTVMKSKVINRNFSDTFPHTFDIPIGGLKNLSRVPRSPVTCSFPQSMNTAAITCKVYPSSISCVQRCAFGYTLRQGIRQQMSCNFKENKWIPNGFEECRPFVDCSLALLSGGTSTCTSMSLRSGPECRVECYHYEDKEAVPEQVYTCSIEGKWSQKLPFCVSAETGLMLVSPPKIKLHGEFDRVTGSTEKVAGKIQKDTKH